MEQQNDFFAKTKEESFNQYLSQESAVNLDETILKNEFGYGMLKQTGWINTGEMLYKYRSFLEKNSLLLNEKFNYEQLNFSEEKITYNSISANKIIFCEGNLVTQNPYFNYLPLVPTKGEVMTVKIPNLHAKDILNKGFFVLPLGNDLYKIGATYDWKNLDYSPTEKGKNELTEKINSLISSDYKILEHNAGIRPTVKDRRPLIGIHPNHKKLAIFNGMGTKGILIAPYYANEFCEFLEGKTSLDKEVNIDRFLGIR